MDQPGVEPPTPGAMLAAPPLEPVPPGERITVIDALRGWALAGILVANMRGFNSPVEVYFTPGLMWQGAADRMAQALIDALVTGKFITIFATLFGVGFAIQMERAAARGEGTGFYVRRLAVLVVIGLAHSFLLWWGDILLAYAVCGFALLLFRRRTGRALITWAMILYWFPAVLLGAVALAPLAGAAIPTPPAPTPAELRETVRIYSQGSLGEIFVRRAQEWARLNVGFVFFFTRVIGIFLIGAWLWRRGVLQDVESHLGWWRRAAVWGGVIGLPGNAMAAWIQWAYQPNPMEVSPLMLELFVIQSIAQPALSLAYAAALVLVFRHPGGRRLLEPFAGVGRMALTNYLLQSVVAGLLFYSYGLRLFGKVGPLAGLAPAAAIYALQAPFSVWWLKRFRAGPVEALWRRLTYGRRFAKAT